MRQSLSSAFNDPIQDFRTPLVARQISKAIDDKSAEIEDRIRKISDSSDEAIGDEPAITSLYVDQREQLVEDLEAHVKEARKIVREALAHTEHSGSQRNDLKRALTQLDESDNSILKERSALAADRMRVKYGVLGQPSHVKVGQAYMMAITDNLPKPAESAYKKKHGRSGAHQTWFRNRLIKSYNTRGSEILGTSFEFSNKMWCPISEREFEVSEMTAAHIVPYSIGETNAAYLFRAKVDEGYDVIWSERNGFMVHNILEKIFDDGRTVIIPDPTDENEFISIILSQDLLNDSGICPATGTPYNTLNMKRLQFQTAARPGKRYLYMHALLSLFRRRRYDVPGWEKDRAQVFTGQIWATPGKWARKSMVQALALEIGDSWGDLETVEGLGEFPDAKSSEEEKRVATLIRYALRPRANDVDDGEDDE
jgi:HNH endonuclease